MTLFRDISLRILITCYGITGLCNFYASRPKREKDDDKIIKTGKNKYGFRIITSLIFFYYGISQFKQTSLVYLTVIEMAIIIIMYIYLIIMERKHSKRYESIIPNRKNLN